MTEKKTINLFKHCQHENQFKTIYQLRDMINGFIYIRINIHKVI